MPHLPEVPGDREGDECLDSILRLLVRDYGKESVRRALDRVAPPRSSTSRQGLIRRKEDRIMVDGPTRRKIVRSRALANVLLDYVAVGAPEIVCCVTAYIGLSKATDSTRSIDKQLHTIISRCNRILGDPAFPVFEHAGYRRYQNVGHLRFEAAVVTRDAQMKLDMCRRGGRAAEQVHSGDLLQAATQLFDLPQRPDLEKINLTAAFAVCWLRLKHEHVVVPDALIGAAIKTFVYFSGQIDRAFRHLQDYPPENGVDDISRGLNARLEQYQNALACLRDGEGTWGNRGDEEIDGENSNVRLVLTDED